MSVSVKVEEGAKHEEEEVRATSSTFSSFRHVPTLGKARPSARPFYNISALLYYHCQLSNGFVAFEIAKNSLQLSSSTPP